MISKGCRRLSHGQVAVDWRQAGPELPETRRRCLEVRLDLLSEEGRAQVTKQQELLRQQLPVETWGFGGPSAALKT